MKFLVDGLKKYVKNVPSNLEEIINLHITEIESVSKISSATKVVVGNVLVCIMHPNSDHLHITKVDVGVENGGVIQIVCGAPNVCAGQYVCVALDGAILPGDFKIKKSIVRGEESNGMICSLRELGIDEKYINDENKKGIFAFKDKLLIGSCALSALFIDSNIIELGLTPNRGDLLSVYGVARDLSAVLDIPLIKPNLENIVFKNKDLKVIIKSDNVVSYCARVFDDIIIKESPLWLQNYLICVGIRPINNVVDITNYCLIEYGAPLHCFDASSFMTNEILVRNAYNGEKIITLDDVTRELNDSDLVITNGSDVCALAGVMGGLESGVTNKTRKIILESAIFNKESIIKTVKKHDLRSESSLRFERGVALENAKLAFEEATKLIISLCNGRLIDATYNLDNYKRSELIIKVEFKQICQKIGLTLKKDYILKILSNLGFSYKVIDSKIINIKFLESRPDILSDVDIIEEVARIYGFYKIKNKSLELSVSSNISEEFNFNKNIRLYFSSLGFNEILTYSLVKDNEANIFDTFNDNVLIVNPLVNGVSTLRQSLLNRMIETINYNQNRKNKDLLLFEIGKVYSKDSEINKLSLAISNDVILKSWNSDRLESSFFILKGIINNFFGMLNLENNITYKADFYNISKYVYNKYRYASIYLNENILIGKIFEISPKYAKESGISDNTTLLELNLDLLFKHKNSVSYNSIPKFPTVLRDLALIIDKNISVGDVIAMIKQTTRKNLVNLEVFDVYDQFSDEKRSVGIRLFLNDNNKTLESTDIDKIVNSVTNRLKFSFNIEIRV